MVVTNLMHAPIDLRSSKTKIIGLPDLRFESKIWRIVGEQLVTLSYSPNL